MKLSRPRTVAKSSTADGRIQRIFPGAVNWCATHLSPFRIVWSLLNISLVLAIMLVIYSFGWEYSTRRYLTGFSDAIVPATAPANEKIETILDWMAYGPARRKLNGDTSAQNRDPTDTLNYEALLKVCGTATNAFINLVDSGGLESRRLLLVDSNQKTNHVVAEVLVDGRWIVVDPAYRAVLHGPDGKTLTSQDLRDPVIFRIATANIRGYDPSYTYQHTLHIHVRHFSVIGRPIQAILDQIFPRWQDSALVTLFVERSSFGAMAAAILLLLFLILLRISVRWYCEVRLGIECRRIRDQLLQGYRALFDRSVNTEITN